MNYKEISEKEALIGSQYGKERDFWLKRLSGEPAKSFFPYDLKRTNGNEYRINSQQYQFSPALSEKLTALSKGLDHRLHIILSAGLAALLHKYTGSSDIIFGVPIYKQEVKGDFINTVLVIRNQFEDNISFKNLLLLVRQNTTEAAENQNYPIEALLKRLNMPYTEGDFPLFDITLLMENIHDKTYIAHIRHNMMFSFLRTGQMIEARLDYNSLLYEKESIDRIMNHFIRLITQVVDNLNLKIPRIEILSEEEKRHLLDDFNHTKSDYPRDKTIHELFQDQVEASPDMIAAVFEGEEVLSYKALDQKANTLAGYLALKSVTVDVMVGIMSERSLETIIGILAILKAGGVYLPIDSHYPAERKEYMIKDSNLEILLENCDYSDIQDIVPGIIDLGNPGIYTEVQDFGKVNRFDNLAYVIYTSGTTANPKGVMVEHRSVVRLVKNTNYVKFQEDDRVLPTGALEFDASTFELWGALLNGLQLHLVSIEKILTHETLKEIIRNYRITTLWMTSPLFNQMVDADAEIFAGLKNLLVGGDALSPFHINKIRKKFPQCNVINGYGPTENTTFSTTYLIKQEYMDSIPIGKPIANSTVYIIDRHNNLAPWGAVGEIWVGGDGVARGYLNNPELTAERFVTISNKSYTSYRTYLSKKIYKTGDLGRWLPDRNIEFLGRIDQQIKIRGYRIEPGEIESQLLKTGLINEAVVLVREYENKEKYLCAYFVSEQEINKTELRSRLLQNLPDYMVPAFFVRLNSIPLTPNKKVDKKVLPTPVFNAEANYVAPRNEIEEKLVKIWLEVLWQDEQASSSSDIQIGIDDNFFELGGHSIKAMSLVSKIHKELNVKLPLEEVFINPSIRRLSEYIKGTVKDRYAAIEPVEEKEYYSLSSAQKRLYFIYQLAPESTAYHLPFSQEVGGDIEIRKLKRIFHQLIKIHESLRTSFISNSGVPFQQIHKTVEFEIQYYSTEGTTQSALNNFVRPFDFSKAPLMRVGVMKLDEDRHLLLVDMHHIITDGFSQNILLKEFRALYSGEELIPSRLHLQYKDFSEWQTSAEQQKRLKQQELYWLKEFSGELPVLNLPTDYPRPLLKSYDGNRVNFLLTEQKTRALKNMALKTDSTLFAITLAIYTILLSKLSSQDDIIVGIPTAGRRHADLEQIIGMFVNALPTRNYPSPDKTFKEYLTEVQTRTLSVLENQDYQFEDLVDKLSVPRDTSRNPIYDVLLNFQELQNNPGDMPVMESQSESPDVKISAKFDLNLQIFYLGTKMYFNLEYCTILFKQETIDRIAGYFKKIVASILENPQQQIMKIEIIPTERKQEILMRFNRDLWNPSVVDTIQGKLVKSSRENRDKIAIEYGEVEITYSQLDKRVGAISGWIRQRGIERSSHIGIYMDNRIDIIAAIIGVLKAGGVFVPLDTALPPKRIETMIVHTDIRHIFTDAHHKEQLCPCSGNIELMVFDEDIFFDSKDSYHIEYNGEDKIYIYFTSGTTGTPEAIVGKNSCLVHFINWEMDTFGVTPGFRVSQLSPVGFDAFLRNVFTPLCGGGVICIPGNRDLVMNGTGLTDWIHRQQIHWVHCVPEVFRLFNTKSLTPHHFKELKYVFLSGEVIVPYELKNWYDVFEERIQLVNYYGATETTMAKFYYLIGKKDINNLRIPVGKPIRGASAIILDENLGVCDRGIIGEIFVRTPYRTLGYYNNEQLNKEKFIPNPFGENADDWVHRPGDIGRELWDGNFEFLGRKDGQVKIRGIRVELGEIENLLQKHEKIKRAAAAIKEVSGESYLCAYIISDIELPARELRKYLSQILPDYMIPSFFIPVDKISLTLHGKTDWKKLPEPGFGKAEKYAAPRNRVEEKLVEIWRQVLFSDERHLSQPEIVIGIDDNFFQLGGHSLKATIMVGKIHEAFDVKYPLGEIFRKPSIRELSESIDRMVKEVHVAIEPVEEKEYYPLSSAQKRLYILHQVLSGYTSYNIPDVIPLEPEIDKEKLEMVFKKMISRHESLRTSFELVNEVPVQRIHREVDFSIVYYEASEEEAGDFISNFSRPFDLSKAPLLKAYLLKVKSGGPVLLIDIHHIITDGASQAILRKEFRELYSGEDYPLLRLQYKDFSQWQNSEKGTEKIRRQEAYWLKVFENEIPVLNLPTDFSRPALQSFAGDSTHMELPVKEVKGLKAIGRTQGATLHMVLMALFNILMSRLANQEDIVIGTPAAGRSHSDLEKIIGMFVNMLAIRTQPKGNISFTTFLSQVKKRMLEAIENQEYHFEELVEKIGVNRDTGRNPLFDIVFSLNIMPADSSPTGPEALGPVYKKNAAKFDLTLVCIESGEHLFLRLEYCVKLFKKETMERFLRYFRVLIASVLENKDMSISRLEIMPAKEKEQVLFDFNNTFARYPKDETIHELFEKQVEKTPDHTALVGNHPAQENLSYMSHMSYISYKELNEKSNRLAHTLIQKGTGIDAIVGIMVQRSIEMIIGILGILKARGVYLPIDPGFPQERIDFMIKDSGAKILLTSPADISSSASSSSSTLIPTCRVSSANLAYIMYTSGSTGYPKGVMVEHKNVIRLVKNTNYVKFSQETRILQTGAPVFDATTFEVWGALLHGGMLDLVPNDVILDVSRLEQELKRNHINTLWLSASLFNQLVQQESRVFTGLEWLLVGGDILSPPHINRVRERNKRLKVVNGYGPTENTTFSTTYLIDRDFEDKIPIGKPINNSTAYILNTYNQLCPIGVVGELYVGGDGVSRGYMNNPELTAEKFCLRQPGGAILKKTAPGKHPDSPRKNFLLEGTRGLAPLLYHTGDLARWLPDGNIDFIGRMDFQVKIRGFRVELGEIENRLSDHPRITESVVLMREDEKGDKYLCAYIVTNREFTISELREYLSKELPDYMIPSYFVTLEKIPLTQNGKVDRKSLPPPETAPTKGYIAPPNEIEKKLVEIWSEVLGIEKETIRIEDNFFHLGGHSLKATIMVSRIRREFNISIPLSKIFITPVLCQLAEYIKNSKTAAPKSKDDNLVLLKNANASTKNLFLVHDGSGEVEGYLEFCHHLDSGFNCWGIRANKIDGYSPLNLDIEDIASQYIQKIKKIQVSGPYYIIGWSLGGTIGFEMIKQLEAMKQEIGFFGMVDSPAPHKKLKKHLAKFNIESELKFLERFLPNDKIIKKTLKKQNEISRLWQEVVRYLDKIPAGTKIARRLATHNRWNQLLDINKFNTRDSIYYLNRCRTLYNAREFYIPNGKINTVLHFFKASRSRHAMRKNWDKYVYQPVKDYEINGDHYSLFKMPAVVNLVKMFEEAVILK